MTDWLTPPAAQWLTARLAEWLPTMRWYGEKSARIESISLVHRLALLDGDPSLDLLVVHVATDRSSQHYQLMIARREDDLPEHLIPFAIGDWQGRTVHEALTDPYFATALGPFFGAREGFALEPGAVFAPATARALTAEQSNTSVVFGNTAILKVFRKLVPGPHRDLELHRALYTAHCDHIAQPLGSMTAAIEGEQYVLGLLQRFLPDAVDGWEMATTSVRDLLAESDLYPEEVGGDFAAEAHRLGAAVATVHADLATICASVNEPIDDAIDAMRTRLDEMAERVPQLRDHLHAAQRVFDAARTSGPLTVQEVHADLHLGQVLRTTTAWVLIDFEGEPSATPTQRAQRRNPLVDVAGMLRSFDYAAHQPIVGPGSARKQQLVRANEWTRRNVDAFCAGYAEVGIDPREFPALLTAFELDKAIYEVGYEHDNRPEWLPIPLTAVARLTSTAH